jgi:tRNA (guanosine-2'-O-)-methyltransferase
MRQELIQYLSEFTTEERLAIFKKVVVNRTRYITVVLEDIYQAQNASAVLRTCDCLGIQDVHIIENEYKFNPNPRIELGSSKWLTIKKYNQNDNNSLSALNEMKRRGYRIVATSPDADDASLDDFDLEKGKIALVFGSEQPGISSGIMNAADEYLKIPMVGFTESFNISVSAAIILHQLTSRLRNMPLNTWQLSEFEKELLMIEWLKISIKKSDLIVRDFILQYQSGQQPNQ